MAFEAVPGENRSDLAVVIDLFGGFPGGIGVRGGGKKQGGEKKGRNVVNLGFHGEWVPTAVTGISVAYLLYVMGVMLGKWTF